MKTPKGFSIFSVQPQSTLLQIAGLLLVLALFSPVAARAAQSGKIYSTPDEAVAALKAAVGHMDTNALGVIFGPAVEDLYNVDRVQATNDLRSFSAALMAKSRLTPLSATTM